MLRSAFDKYNLQLSGPTLSIFQRFKTSWPKLNQKKFKTGIVDKTVQSVLSSAERNDLGNFARKYIAEKHPRADYKELLELVLVFLGLSEENKQFKAPGALHHARWMAKALYCLKIFIFRNQFSMSSAEFNAILEISLFILKIYIKPWIEAPIAAKAPFNDLNFAKNVMNYSVFNTLISQEVTKKILNHLWYLTPEAVALAFFDETIDIREKKEMIKQLSEEEKNENKKISISLEELKSKKLSDFVNRKTLQFFDRLSIPVDFLSAEPSEWKNHPSFTIGSNIVKNLFVVNDTAERFVKLMEDYNVGLTKNEEEKQFILQMVTNYRKQYSTTNKKDLCN